MKKVLFKSFGLLLLMAIIPVAGISAKSSSKKLDYWKFHNKDLRQFIYRNYDKNQDFKLSKKELKKIKSVQLDYRKRVVDVRDIGKLPYVTSIRIDGSYKVDEKDLVTKKTGGIEYVSTLPAQIKGIKTLYKMKKLKSIEMEHCQLEELKTSNWKNLKNLKIKDCYNFRKLSLKKNKKLESLHIESVKLKKLDVSANKELKSLSYSGRKYLGNQEKQDKVTELDLRNNKKLTSLALNWSADISLDKVSLYQNGAKIQKLDFRFQIDRKEIDVSRWNLQNLKEFYCTHAYDDSGRKMDCAVERVIIGDVPNLQTVNIFLDPTLKYIQIGAAPKLTSFEYSNKASKIPGDTDNVPEVQVVRG